MHSATNGHISHNTRDWKSPEGMPRAQMSSARASKADGLTAEPDVAFALAGPGQSVKESSQANRASHAGGPLRILLVDDDPDCRLLLKDAITECGQRCEVAEVSDGAEALSYLRGEGRYAGSPRPQLIYLDIEMPRLDGLETLRRIKQDAALREIPVVMMTGVTGESEKRRAAEYGANSYTLKPADAEQFLRTVLTSTSYWLTVHQYPDKGGPGRPMRPVTSSAPQ